MRTHSGSPSVTVCSTSRAVDSDSITPPGGATDSIRCANPDLLTDRGVSQRPRTNLTGDHLTGVKAHPHLEVHTVALSDFDAKPLRLLLNAQRPPSRHEWRDPPTPPGRRRSPSPRRR